MASSMLTGERRWASSRRGGMTVLGKVAVPKPINLPSQRLESHGQDRDVEIVPKGTLSWGSKPSSSTASAWGTSAQSPNTDGGTGSPSHLSGRPSSGGSGTRPSTAGSDITHERSASAWGPSSRPSSASGSLTSNQQSLISLRPHSAETRLGSSQLSRFAESVSDTTTAWGAGAADKLGTTSSKSDGFPLTSGDFPTLGLDKESSGRNTESQDRGPQGRPGSSSGGGPPRKEDFGNSVGDFPLHGNARSGNSNSWRRETQPYSDDGARPSINNWHAEPQPYPNSSIPHQHYDAWHGPPVNNHSGGVWYRGHPGGPPFGSGGFPMEPFPYYRPQVAPPALQAVSGGGTGPRGPHPQNGDFYRPHMHDAFVRPGMSMRPGFYPGPVPCDGYYGPPLGFANPNEREISSMGMTVGPSAYNLFTGPNAPDVGNSHRLGGYAPSSKAMALEQMESGRSHDARSHDGRTQDARIHEARTHDARIHDARTHDARTHDARSHDARTHDARTHDARTHDARTHDAQSHDARTHDARSHDARTHDARTYDAHTHEARTHDTRAHGSLSKVLLNQYDCREDQDEQLKRENINSYSSRSGEDDRKRHSSTERSWNVDRNRDGEADCRKVTHGGGSPWELNDQRGLLVEPKFPASLGNSKGGVNSFRRLDLEEHGAPRLPEVPETPRNPTSLMQKIEGLNAKVRVTDGLQDVKFLSGREEQKYNLQVSEPKTNTHGKGADSGLISHETRKNHISPGESAVTSGTAIFRKSNQSVHGRADHHGRGRLGTKEADGQHERSRVTNVAAGSTVDFGNSVSHGQDSTTIEAIVEAVESSSLHPRDKLEGGLSPSAADLSDTQLQRATMLELAKLRLQQREKEEEERARDQKAKALAKLEELNRRTQGEESAQKLENVSLTSDQIKQEERLFSIQTTVAAGNARASVSVLGPKPNSVVIGGEINPNRVEKAPSLSGEGLLETPKIDRKEHFSVQKQLKNLLVKSDDPHHVNSPRIYDKGVPQQKGTSHVQKQNMPLEKKSVDKTKSSPVAGNTTVYFGGVAVEISSSGDTGSPVSTAVMTETSVQQKKKSWGGKNKLKLEETSANLASASSASEDKSTLPDTTAQGSVVESVQSRTLEDAVNTPSVQYTDSKNANQSLEQRAPSPNEDANGRVNNQWKSLHSKRIPRNPIANRSTEKLHGTDSVVWAPVRPQNKAEVSDEVGQKNIVDDPSPSIKSDQLVQHIQRNKRTEMERYIPKQVAKEVAHSIRQATVPLIIQATQDVKVKKSHLPKEDTVVGFQVGVRDTESPQTYSTTAGKVVSSMESKNGDGKLSKNGKTYGPWRKRGPAESTGSCHLDHGKNLPKLTGHPEPLGSDVVPGKEQSQSVDEWSTSDDWNTPETPVAPAPVLGARDLGLTAGGKRQPFEGQKGAGYIRDSDDKRINGGDSGKGSSQTPAVELHLLDSTAISKERRVVGDQSISHWQPKSHVPATTQRGSRSCGTQNVVNEMSRFGGKDSIQLPPQSEMENTATQQPSQEQSLSQEVSVIEHQETRRERRSTSQRGRPGRLGESSALQNMDNQHEQHAQSGFHKSTSQNSRFLGGQDSHKDWGVPGKDYRQNSVSVNRERYRHNPHYEYQPVGPQNYSKVNVQEPPRDGSQNSSSRFKERNHGHSRRGAGHFNGRQSGSIQVDASDK